jgi:NADP-dependent 3-hydroxy acid dehydrogenase YdfG
MGGIDIVVPNAEIAYVSKIDDMDPDKLRSGRRGQSQKGPLRSSKASIPVFRRQGTGGNIVVISSKNVFDPGAAFGAYSASKAGRASDFQNCRPGTGGIRSPREHGQPDAVFGDEGFFPNSGNLSAPKELNTDAWTLKD